MRSEDKGSWQWQALALPGLSGSRPCCAPQAGRGRQRSSFVRSGLLQHVREAVSYRGLFTAGWFGVREKHCFRLKIYDHLRASKQAVDGQRDCCSSKGSRMDGQRDGCHQNQKKV